MKPSVVVAALSIGLVSALWPIPSSYESGNQVLWINGHVELEYHNSKVCFQRWVAVSKS